MDKKKKIIIAAVVLLVAGGGFYLFSKSKNQATVKQIDLDKKVTQKTGPANDGPVSPITGVSCENWNRRPVAVMQPSDVQARPAAGFSEADMVIEMPGYTASVTRLLGVYGCNIPKEIGAIRSSRHDYIALAKGLDAFFIHWGGSHFALDLLKDKVIDHMDCMSSNYCSRWEMTGAMRYEDTGHVTQENVLAAMKSMNIRETTNFQGYPHQEEAPLDQRPTGGHLRAAFAKPYDVEWDYDKDTNTWLRTWAEVPDTDRNTGTRLATKNVVVMFAVSDQITTEQDYVGKGLQDPWKNVEEIKKTGAESISGRYNNVQIGDPWYDTTDSGEAYYYVNGKQYKGAWKKDKSKLDSKLYFLDENGEEFVFAPGQIWVDILEPGQAHKWVPGA